MLLKKSQRITIPAGARVTFTHRPIEIEPKDGWRRYRTGPRTITIRIPAPPESTARKGRGLLRRNPGGYIGEAMLETKPRKKPRKERP